MKKLLFSLLFLSAFIFSFAVKTYHPTSVSTDLGFGTSKWRGCTATLVFSPESATNDYGEVCSTWTIVSQDGTPAGIFSYRSTQAPKVYIETSPNKLLGKCRCSLYRCWDNIKNCRALIILIRSISHPNHYVIAFNWIDGANDTKVLYYGEDKNK